MRTATRVVQLWVGLAIYAVSMDLMVRANLGLDPWDVFHQGVSRRVDISMGTVVVAVGVLVLLAWIPLRQRPGFGTVCNAVLIGIVFDRVLPLIPVTHRLDVRIPMLIAAVVLCAVATGMYVSVGWGAGPRDGLMTGLARRTGLSVRVTRTAIEVTVLACGWLLGGSVGIGTVIFAVTIGPLAQLFLRLFGYEAASPTPQVPVPAGDAVPTGDAVATQAAAGPAT